MTDEEFEDRKEAYHTKLLADISEPGWTVIGVFPNEGVENQYCFAYTIGLYKNYGHPEIIMTGLQIPTMHSILNIAGTQIKKSQAFNPEDRFANLISKFDVKFAWVDKKYYVSHLGQAQWYYENDDFSTMQLIWPDADGKFSDEEGFEEEYRDYQPMLTI